MGGIYTASKTTHAQRWRMLRAVGCPVIATWIDEAGQGQTSDFADLWERCISEAAGADCVILYRQPGEVLKGALVEAGAALASGKPVLFAGDKDGLGSFLSHRLAEECEGLTHAIQRATAICDAADLARSNPATPNLSGPQRSEAALSAKDEQNQCSTLPNGEGEP